MYKRMTLKLATRMANCSKSSRENRVYTISSCLNDDIFLLNYKKVRIRMTIYPKDGIGQYIPIDMLIIPTLYKKQKYKKYPNMISRFKNRQYFRSNINLLERRRFIKEYRK